MPVKYIRHRVFILAVKGGCRDEATKASNSIWFWMLKHSPSHFP